MSSWRVGLFVLGITVAAVARAGEATVVSGVLGPEGPLYVDGSLYYVAWTSSTLNRWDGKHSTVLNHTPGCGHNGLALTARRTFLVACIDHGAILELDLTGKQLRRWDKDSREQPFTGGINDIVVAANGGAYATVFGVMTTTAAPPGGVIGRILYLPPGGHRWATVAENLNYANGIGIAPDQKTLYVAETVGNCILKFSINADGSLSDRSNFALLNHLVPDKRNTPWIGPDSMKVDAAGNLYVAQWSGGKILKLSSQARLLHVFEVAAGDGTTNVAFGPGGRDLYVTVVADPDDSEGRGSIVRIPNAE